MLGNAQRRDTAKELRRAAMGAYRHVDALDIIAGAVGVDISGMCTHEAEETVYAVLAGLIDRPTCHIRETDHEFEDSVRCDRCQVTFNRPWEPFKFCPSCGAEVIE